MGSNERFQDPGGTVHELMACLLVVCPQCQGCARNRRIEPSDVATFAPRRLVCDCGYSKAWTRQTLAPPGNARDQYFELPLWLQTPCCGEILWAYNREHLDLIESLVAAKQRERARDDGTRDPWDPHGSHVRSLVSRLPKWIRLAKNRASILLAVQKLRDRLDE